jgi:hypothetical protein
MRLGTESGADTVDVQVSTDGGTTWRSLRTLSGDNPDTPGWTTYSAAFPAPGGAVQVRFTFTSDELCSSLLHEAVCSSSATWDGVHVDDVRVGTAS